MTNAILSGASPGQALVAGLQGAVIGAISAGGARFIGHHMGFAPTDYFQRAIAHGIFRGVLAKVQGGNFGNGFMSAFASTMFGKITDGLRYAATEIKAAVHALVGGTVSVISGGKFANGAVSSLVVYLFNDTHRTGLSDHPISKEELEYLKRQFAKNVKTINELPRAMHPQGTAGISDEQADFNGKLAIALAGAGVSLSTFTALVIKYGYETAFTIIFVGAAELGGGARLGKAIRFKPKPSEIMKRFDIRKIDDIFKKTIKKQPE